MSKMRWGVSESVSLLPVFHNPGNVLIFGDTETTGIDKERDPLTGRIIEDEVTELSGAKYLVLPDMSLKLLEQREWYFKPTIPVPPVVEELTGITNEFLADKPAWNDVHKEIKAFMGDHVFVAHNTPFDLKMISRMYSRAGDEYKPVGTMDTLAMARYCYPNATSHKLGDMISQLKLQWKVDRLSGNGSYHNATTDVYALVSLYEEIRINGVAKAKARWVVPYIVAAWHKPGFNHKQTATVFKTQLGKIEFVHYSKEWKSDEVDLSQISMAEFERVALEYTGAEDLRAMMKYGMASVG